MKQVWVFVQVGSPVLVECEQSEVLEQLVLSLKVALKPPFIDAKPPSQTLPIIRGPVAVFGKSVCGVS